ncbi:MAG: biotin--[acetyl-CoA-carboxylase] ligase [Rickettsiales bacterium]|nr:biotin--[acetyl-CoA-carboxylase] ligase [Rickettsiales bacterium]
MALEGSAESKRRAPLIDDYHLLTYQQLDSTNEEARRLAEGGGAHGAFIWTHAQSGGRGRRGRDWISQKGNLFVSALLSPDCEFGQFPQLSFVAAAAAHASVAPLLPDSDLKLKWPNDLLLEGEKLAGLLLESFETIDEETGELKRWAVVGLGMNIENAPAGMDLPATCLKHAGVDLISAKIVLSRFIHHFIEWYQLWQDHGFEPIRKYWMNHSLHKGQQVEVLVGEQFYSGKFVGLDETGNLLLKPKGAKEISLSAGEVLLS